MKKFELLKESILQTDKPEELKKIKREVIDLRTKNKLTQEHGKLLRAMIDSRLLQEAPIPIAKALKMGIKQPVQTPSEEGEEAPATTTPQVSYWRIKRDVTGGQGEMMGVELKKGSVIQAIQKGAQITAFVIPLASVSKSGKIVKKAGFGLSTDVQEEKFDISKAKTINARPWFKATKAGVVPKNSSILEQIIDLPTIQKFIGAKRSSMMSAMKEGE